MIEKSPLSNFSFGLSSLRWRLVFWFILSASVIVAVGTAVVYTSGLASIQATLGQTYCQIGSRVVDEFEGSVIQEIALIRNIATDVLTTEVALEAAAIYQNRPQEWVDTRLMRLEKEWKRASHRERKANLHRQLTHRFDVLARLEPDLIVRLSLYDHNGLLLSSSKPPARVLANKKGWFKAVGTMQRHFTFLDLDRKRGVLEVVIPVWGGVDIIGYVVAQYRFGALNESVRKVQFGDSGEALLVDYAGVSLLGPQKSAFIQAMSQKPPSSDRRLGLGEQGFSANYWVAVSSDADGAFWKRLVCVAPLKSINSLRARFKLPPWSAIVTQAPVESYAALRNTLGSLGVAGILLVLVVTGAGALIGLYVTTPLKELQTGVRRFARGERSYRVDVSSGDEIGELADEFNRMADRVAISENELRAFAQAVSDAADAILMTTPDGSIYYVNPAFEMVSGYDADDVESRRPDFLVADDKGIKLFAQILDETAAGASWRGELNFARADGERYPVDLTVSPIFDDSGKIAALIGIYRDITLAHAYQGELEKEVEARTQEIKEKEGLTVMGRMASMIAHDLRNALSTVKMTLQILDRKRSDQDELEQEHFGMGLSQVRYMEDILRDMLSFARPEGINPDWQDLDQVLDGALATVTASLTENNVTVVREDNRGLPKTHCDRVKMMQVFQNLFENAIQAMPEGGTLEVSTILVLNEASPSVEITVRDNGSGIADDVLQDIFEPFFTTRTKGSGLGLAIVKRIVEQHKGRVEMMTELGVGTIVRVILPTEPSSV